MRWSFTRPLVLAVAAVVLSSGAASGQPLGGDYEPETEKALLGIGCQQGAGGTCDSVDYWLGLTAGQSSVGNAGTFTPLGWLSGQTDEPSAFASFPGDTSLAPSYLLRTEAPLTGRISVGGWVSGGEVAVDSTVRVVVEAINVATKKPVTLADVTVNKPVVTPGAATAASRRYDFSAQIPSTVADRTEVRNLQLVLYVDSVTVLQHGFVDGKGGSWIELPYYRPVIES